MKFETVYKIILPLWGNTINYEDGKPHLDDGFHSMKLSENWDRVEQEVGFDNKWNSLMVWTMFQVFHQIAKTNFENDVYEFDPKDVDTKLIEERYFENLSDEHYLSELAEYQRN